MLRVNATLVGVVGLLMHNPQLADPLNKCAKAMKEITSKRKKTDEDYALLAQKEFEGGLYLDKELGPYVPDTMIHANIVKGASDKRGFKKTAQSAILMAGDRFPLNYKGPRDLEGLWADANFRDTRAAVVPATRSRVMRTRPLFREWSVDIQLSLDTEMWNLDEFKTSLERAGSIEGLGDYRPVYGRYEIKSIHTEEFKGELQAEG